MNAKRPTDTGKGTGGQTHRAVPTGHLRQRLSGPKASTRRRCSFGFAHVCTRFPSPGSRCPVPPAPPSPLLPGVHPAVKRRLDSRLYRSPYHRKAGEENPNPFPVPPRNTWAPRSPRAQRRPPHGSLCRAASSSLRAARPLPGRPARPR